MKFENKFHADVNKGSRAVVYTVVYGIFHTTLDGKLFRFSFTAN